MDISQEIQREARFKEVISDILGQQSSLIHLSGIKVFDLKKADIKDDQENGFDFVFTANGLTIPVRIRKPNCRYRDFTIRSRSRYGMRTEKHKIKDGAGDVYFYAWTSYTANACGEQITDWILVNLHKFRDSGLADSVFNRMETDNRDGTMFVSIGISELKQNKCLIAHSDTESIKRRLLLSS